MIHPVFAIDAHGTVTRIGALVRNGENWDWEDHRGLRCLDYLPWFIQMLRPEGFLGRRFGNFVRGRLGVSANPDDWSDAVLLEALTLFPDPPGNLTLCLDRPRLPVIEQRRIEDRFPQMVDQLRKSATWTSSSVGGQRSKFTAVVDDGSKPRHVIVKFSPPTDSPIGRRIADLLVAEHLALETIKDFGIETAASRIHQIGDRIYLESQRFDRTPKGRLGIVPLGVLDDEFRGRRDNWTAAAADLAQQGVVHSDVVATVRWLEDFGDLIGNTDRHFGNLSLRLPDAVDWWAPRGLWFAPVYDFLPMRLAPVHGELPESDPKVPDRSLEPSAHRQAMAFWDKLRRHPMVSPEFSGICEEWLEALDNLGNGFRLET